MLTCAPHWRMVPVAIQREVYATVVKRGPNVDVTWAPWWRAQTRALHAIMEAEKRDPERLAKWFAHELAFAKRLEERS
jgi:hypothetical protein